LPPAPSTVGDLDRLLSEPSEAVIEAMRRVGGDIMLLGVGGKIGPSLARMARLASDRAGVARRVIGVSRFSSSEETAKLEACGIETIRCDLLDEAAVSRLPDAPNVIYLAGLKFGSTHRAAATWAMNTYLPAIVCRRFRASRIVAYSTGAIYGFTSEKSGSHETDTPQPVGEYAMSCLGRERMFEYFSGILGIPQVLIRLFYASELRYGVLVDLARKIANSEPIDLGMGWFNIIWQGDNNAATLLALEHTATPPFVINLTGPEVLSVRESAEKLGSLLGKRPVFAGTEAPGCCLGDATKAVQLFGLPRVTAATLIEWSADWVKRGGAYLGKPTHFEVRDGRY
jgi:dTDP-4-dehydrorhamnose reductase